jgi:hypothetical protein
LLEIVYPHKSLRLLGLSTNLAGFAIDSRLLYSKAAFPMSAGLNPFLSVPLSWICCISSWEKHFLFPTP